GDHPGTGGSGLEHDPSGTAVPDRAVHDRLLDHRHLEEVLLGLLDAPLDGGRNLFGLAVSDADGAVEVTHDHERGEGGPAATLDHPRDAVDRDDLLLVRVALLFATAPAAATTTAVAVCLCHVLLLVRGRAWDRPPSRVAYRLVAVRIIRVRTAGPLRVRPRPVRRHDRGSGCRHGRTPPA